MDAENIYLNLGQRIRDLRKGLGWTQDRLAKGVGISRASLANMEAGRQQVLVHHLFAIAEVLNLESPMQLLLSPQTGSLADANAVPLPIAGDGLTDKQRREVLSLMNGVFDSSSVSSGRDDV